MNADDYRGLIIMEQSTLAGYKEDDVEKYQILATLDHKTSDICREQDSKVYDMKKAVTGVNYPPFHPFCRSTTVPYYGDDDLLEETRASKDPVTGKTDGVKANMTYEEWHKKYVEGNPKAVLEEKKWKNRHGDKKQYEEYKEKLGSKYLPKSFDEFQNVKYSDKNEYGVLKAQAKGTTYHNKVVANEPMITEHVKNVADTVGMDCVGLEYRIKGKDSYLRKIRSNYSPNGNEYEVKDIIRYTYASSPLDLSEKTINAIDTHSKLGYNTIEIKNYWMNKRNPYNGINTILRTPDGQPFEVQYHTPESYKIKDKMHSDYEKWRLIDDKSSKEAQELRKSMFELSSGMTIPVDIQKVR